jgi:diazepam-binding inhibitor (GABA receptor modulating acyl-CoA-binding protein)
MSTNDINTQFNQSAIDVQNLKIKPSTEQLLQLYGLYKQSLFGSNKEKTPGFFDFKSKSKFEAWDKYKTLSKNMAKTQYIKLVEELKIDYGFDKK